MRHGDAVINPWFLILVTTALSACSVDSGSLSPTSTGPIRGTMLSVSPAATSIEVIAADPTTSPGSDLPPKFSGRLIAYSDNRLIIVTAANEAEPVSVTEFPTDLPFFGNFVPSRDGRYLLASYPGTSSTQLYDLDTGESHELWGDSECLAWSPDGSRFSYYAWDQASEIWALRVYDLTTRESSFVFKPPSDLYASADSIPRVMYAELTCGTETWLSGDHLLFQSYEGAMPSEMLFGPSPNRTFLASPDSFIPLDMTETLVTLEDVCFDGSYALLRDSDYNPLLAPTFTTLADINAQVLPCDDCYDVALCQVVVRFILLDQLD